MQSIFSRERRGIPKTIRMTDNQRTILDRLVFLRSRTANGSRGSTSTDVILEALDQYTRQIIQQTQDEVLKQLISE